VDDIVCPKCSFAHDINNLEWFDLYDIGDHEKDCTRCGVEILINTDVKEFDFTVEVFEEE
jgi:DNA-directed RNA polymerase subunit RPC12/RpoP